MSTTWLNFFSADFSSSLQTTYGEEESHSTFETLNGSAFSQAV